MIGGEHTSVFSDGEVESIKTEIKVIIRDTLLEILPEILRVELPKILVDVNEQTKLSLEARRDAEEYMNQNPDKFNEVYKKRIKLFEGYARCENLTKLYDECLQCNPVYIPRKFRDDKFFIRDEEELAIVNIRFMGKFKSEYDLLKKRQRDFASAINAEDDTIYNFIEHCGVPNNVKTEMATIWERDVKSDEEKINNKWIQNITGIKIAHEKDKQKLAELNQQKRRKFEELRRPQDGAESGVPTEEGRSVRQVEVHDAENRIVISISSNNVDNTDNLTQVPSAPNIEDVPQSTATSGNIPSIDIGEEKMMTGETALQEDIFRNNVLADDTIHGSTENETFNSSVPLFGSQHHDSTLVPSNTFDVNSFSTQDVIRNLAGNFTPTPAALTTKVQSNYKFRRRPPLKC